MQTLHIAADRPYEVHIGAGLLDGLGTLVRAVCPRALRAAIVADDTVDALYGARAAASLAGAGLSVPRFSFAHGEMSKSLSVYGALLSALAAQGLCRSDCVLALGGGVTGDLAGFAAATYLRGVDVVQVPTTLVAALDAAVGGKTALDLPEGKNLVGAFHRPVLTVCDTDTLKTLPPNVLRDGLAEAVKCAVIEDEKLLSALSSDAPLDLEALIRRCIAVKARLVEADERDLGVRQLLNLGHTAAHAIEQLSAMRISHGQAVAMGLMLIARAAAANGLCDPSVPQRIEAAMLCRQLPTECPFDPAAVAKAAWTDKKRTGDRIAVIVPEAIGRCRAVLMTEPELTAFFLSGRAGVRT